MNTKRILVAMLPLLVASSAIAQQINTTLNGEKVRFTGTQPMMSNGHVLVPIRGIFEQMGAFVDWTPATRSIHAEDNNGKQVDLRIGERYARVDGQTVPLDSPAIMVRGRAMVPLRFISESMGALVNWNENYNTVAITTVLANGQVTSGERGQPIARTFSIPANTVIPFKLDRQLTSDGSSRGEKFTATIDTDNVRDYVGLPVGTIVEGHVDAVRADTSSMPGVLSLAFDDIRLPNGTVVEIDGSLMGLDNKSVENRNGRMVARQPSKKNMKYVGIGAGAGALVAIVTKGNVLTTAVIGAALGYLYDSSSHKPVQHGEVTLVRGTAFGVMLNQVQTFPVTTQG